MLKMRERQSLTVQVVLRYKRSTKKEKALILSEFVENTGYNRSYAARAIRNACHKKSVPNKKVTKSRLCIYDPKIIIPPLFELWNMSNFICGKRLAPLIPEYLSVLRRDHLWDYSSEVDVLLTHISAATIDRLLISHRKALTLRGRTTTKPGTLLKHQIPVRTWSDWNENIPGFFETDTVTFCGGSLSGDFAWGLNMTDVCTGWVLLELCDNRGQYAIHESMKKMMARLVYPVLGIDSDNGGEFINDILYRYCLDKQITFTRTRSGKKNDNCYVEQKNFTCLRTFLGYSRIETEQQLAIAREIINLSEIFINYFQSSVRLIEKKRIGTHIIKRYDTATTPYQRLLRYNKLSSVQKTSLNEVYSKHNPQELTQKIRALQKQLRSISSSTI